MTKHDGDLKWTREVLKRLPEAYVMGMPVTSLGHLFDKAEKAGLTIDEFIEWHGTNMELDDFIAARKK